MAVPKTKAKKKLEDVYPIPERVRKNILILMRENRDSAERICSLLGICERTWLRRTKKKSAEPGLFTLADIQVLCDYWHITPDVLFRIPLEAEGAKS